MQSDIYRGIGVTLEAALGGFGATPLQHCGKLANNLIII